MSSESPPRRSRRGAPPEPAPAPYADLEPEGGPLPFTPVPLDRVRRDGWTEGRQRAFIAAFERIGGVGAAASSVGMGARSAYKLRGRAGAESFAAAWDLAVEMGLDALRDSRIERALHGELVPVFFRGRKVGVVRRHYDRLAIALLSGRGRNVVEQRAEAARRREVARVYAAEAKGREAAEREAEEVAEANRRAWEDAGRAVAAREAGGGGRSRDEAGRPPRARPRIRFL